jgi:hypothetical protein
VRSEKAVKKLEMFAFGAARGSIQPREEADQEFFMAPGAHFF